jgi:phosphonate transport system ATP-binding protein
VDVHLENITAYHPAREQDEVFALKNVSFQVKTGEHVAIIGPSGSGKTSLLQIIAAAMKPQSGVLSLGGINPWSISGGALRQLRQRLFYAPQIPPLPPRQRVVTSLSASRLGEMGLSKSILNLIYPQYSQDAFDTLSLFDLSEKLWSRVDRLSGGERQRVGLAKILMSRADLWLVDEPLSALDPKRSRQAIQMLIAEAKKRGVTLIVTLHQVDVATKEFSRVIGLQAGELAFDLPSDQITKNILQNLYAQSEHENTQLEAHVFHAE